MALAVGVAAIAAAAPASAPNITGYSQNNGYGQNYSYSQPYAPTIATETMAEQYAYGANTDVASQQCSAAVQNRLYNRSSIGGILGAVLGTNTRGQVLSITQVEPRGNGTVRVRGLARKRALCL